MQRLQNLFKMVWYLDFEAYHYQHKFYIKEIAILNKETLECFNYHVRNPMKMPYPPYAQSIDYQYKRHKLKWTFGNYNIWEVLDDITSKVKDDTIYAKGPEKVQYLQKWLPNVEEMTWIKTPFSKLYNCNDVCDIDHGLCCARRKVHELRYVDSMYKN